MLCSMKFEIYLPFFQHFFFTVLIFDPPYVQKERLTYQKRRHYQKWKSEAACIFLSYRFYNLSFESNLKTTTNRSGKNSSTYYYQLKETYTYKSLLITQKCIIDCRSNLIYISHDWNFRRAVSLVYVQQIVHDLRLQP